MAVLKVYYPIDMFTESVWFGVPTVMSETEYRVEGGLRSGSYFGDFSYDDWGNISGTVTGMEEYSNGEPLTTLSGASADAFELSMKIIAGGNAQAAYEYILRGDDRIITSASKDVASGFGGNDRIYGRNGADTLYGDSGRDKLLGGAGNDVLAGGIGNDKLFGGGGRDRLDGGAGKDRVVGNAGNDRINGGSGRDKLDGGSGNDTVKGGGGADTFIFDLGSDRLIGGRGLDTVEFDGAFGDYDVKLNKKVIVTLGDDRDVLLGMERLEFDDVIYVHQSSEWVEIG